MAGRDRQRGSLAEQLASLSTQMNNVRPLLDKGFYPRNKFLELDRERAKIEGDLGAAGADVARLGQLIQQSQLQIGQVQQKYQGDISQNLDKARARLSDLREKLVIAEDVLRRIDVRAERDGIVMNMKVHTIGAVVKPGDTLAEIVPVGEGLNVMAHVSPRDIESVTVGQKAEVRFPNFSSRQTPIILGRVESVSANSMIDDTTKQPYYSAKIVIDYTTLSPEIAQRILPGMQADVLISTGERTVLEYLVGPLMNSMAKTFREKVSGAASGPRDQAPTGSSGGVGCGAAMSRRARNTDHFDRLRLAAPARNRQRLPLADSRDAGTLRSLSGERDLPALVFGRVGQLQCNLGAGTDHRRGPMSCRGRCGPGRTSRHAGRCWPRQGGRFPPRLFR